MGRSFRQKILSPIALGTGTFILLMLCTQYIAYERHLILKARTKEILEHELASAKGKFTDILYSDISAANTLALIYKEYGEPANFDSVASQIISRSSYVDAIQLTNRGIITQVYPNIYKETIGINTFKDSLRKYEALEAVNRNAIYFAGPRRLRLGGTGILGKVPVITNKGVSGFVVVLTKMDRIKKALNNNTFSYKLTKIENGNKPSEYYLTSSRPYKLQDTLSVNIPEGNWKLSVALSTPIPYANVYIISLLGLMVSILTAAFVYNRAKLPAKLKRIIQLKTNELSDREKYFRTIIENSTDVIALFDEHGKALYRTPSFEKVTGYSIDEINSVLSVALLDPDEQANAKEEFRKLAATPNGILHKGYKIKHKEGHYVYIDGIYRNLLHNENVNAIVYTYSDVTSQVMAALQMDKVNHEISLLNKVNDLILRNSEEDLLLNEVTDCIVNYGGYTLAWIGFMPSDSDSEKRVIPTFAKGATEYLHNIVINLTSDKISNGPTATVLLTGKKVITNNVNTSESFQPWLEDAQANNISSSIVLPLFFNGDLATLNIYCDKTGAFDHDEVNILERLASNVSLAISSLRTKKEKEQVQFQLKERLKELYTIYNLNELLKNDNQATIELLQNVVEIIPSGWQYPEDCEAKIKLGEFSCQTSGYQKSDWVQLALFTLADGSEGCIEVIYTWHKPTEDEGPFLKEERDLINTIADTLVIYFNKVAQQRSLAESEAKFRSAFEYAAMGMTLTALDGSWLMVNAALCEMFGYSKEELTAMTFMDITHPDDIDDNLSMTQQLLDGTLNYFRTYKRYIHKNGGIVWGSLNVAIVRDSDGEPKYFVTQIKNITDRIETQMKFQSLVENSSVSVYILQDGRLVYVNPTMVHETGYTEEELKNITLEEFVHADDRQIVIDNVEKRIKKEDAAPRYEVRVYKKDGSEIWMELFGKLTSINGKPAIIGTMINITDKKQAYLELEKYAANMTSIFDATDISYLLMDVNTRVISFNKYFYNGYKEQTGIELQIGKPFRDSLMPDKRENIDLVLAKVAETKQIVEYETMYNNRDEEKYFTVRISPVISNENFIGYCYAGVDITKRKKMELERERILNDLVRRNKDLEQFSHILSHNVRAPISTILGLAHLFKSDQSQADNSRIVDGVEEAATQLDNVIKDLNEILAARNYILEARTKIDLNNLADDVSSTLKATIKEKNVIIEYDFSNAQFIYSVKSYLHSIFYNLISNSIKFARNEVLPHIRISSEMAGKKLILTFKDNGTGIDIDRNKEQLFGLYKRFHFDIEGKGLGLFMVKTQVEALGGTIEVDSIIGKGTQFSVKFDM